MLPGLTLPASLAVPAGRAAAVFHRAVVSPRSAAWPPGWPGRCAAAPCAACCWARTWPQAWPHDRAHYFFARARWQLDELGLAVARLVGAAAGAARRR